MEKKGYKQLEVFSLLPENGDILALAILPWPEPMNRDLAKRLIKLETVSSPSPLPIRMMSLSTRAGFYSNEFDAFTFPFIFTEEPVEMFIIYIVQG